ncbi:MAG: hypothetical protein PVI40_00495 [Chlamydiota bacterium]|jgi:hypothetical protein
MKKLIYLFLVCISSSLLGQESFSGESFPSKVEIEVVPYVYGDIFQPGYGLSIRAGISAHTFELAPMSIPPSRGYFGNSSARIGVTGSYYYTFRRGKIFQPYLGFSFTHLRDTHRSVYQEYQGDKLYKEGKSPVLKENFIDSIIGMQVCIPNKKFVKAYLFGDVLGCPMCIADLIGEGFKYAEVGLRPLPRVGAGLQF